VLLPASRVIDALKAFRVEFPTVSLRLYMEALGAVTQMVREDIEAGRLVRLDMRECAERPQAASSLQNIRLSSAAAKPLSGSQY